MQLKQVFHSLAVVCITISVFIPVVFQAAALFPALTPPVTYLSKPLGMSELGAWLQLEIHRVYALHFSSCNLRSRGYIARVKAARMTLFTQNIWSCIATASL
jgi:hypothetical protein